MKSETDTSVQSGEMERAIEIPGKGVYDCTFGGPNLDKLYVATSDTDETNVMRDLPGQILSFDLALTHPGVRGLGNKQKLDIALIDYDLSQTFFVKASKFFNFVGLNCTAI